MPIERMHGPNIRPKDQKGINAHFERQRSTSYTELKAKEMGRTELHDRMFRFSEELIREECLELGVSEATGLAIERYIVLSAEDFAAEVGPDEYTTGAFYNPGKKLIVLNRDAPKPMLFRQQLHESIHAHSFHDFMALPVLRSVSARRLGLDQAGYTETPTFTGLNEAITERLAWRLSGVNKAKIQHTFHFSEDEMRIVSSNRAYDSFIDLLNEINSRIAKGQYIHLDDVWDIWTKAMFTGEMMGIRRLERVWGEGSLRILSRLGYDKQTDVKVFKFFNAKSESVREKIRRELLEI
jgi:hypothetical protein